MIDSGHLTQSIQKKLLTIDKGVNKVQDTDKGD